MMQKWEPDMVRFMRDASENGTYNRELASLIGPQLAPNSRICDAGCGLGYLSLELAAYAKHVTAVDVNADALAVLRENRREQCKGNISIRCGDITLQKPDLPYDAMVFCFFGNIHEVLRIAQQQCSGDVFMISRNYSNHRFSVDAHEVKYGGYQEGCEYLKTMQIPFTGEERALEIGQPFASLDDARRFFELYSKDEKSRITDEFLWNKLEKTERTDFPLYMPHKRHVGIIHFHTKDIPLMQIEEKENIS